MTNPISSISSSLYPLPQPLSFILRHALCQDTDFNRDQNTTKLALLKEDMQVGLELLIQNCFMAIDALYFSTYVDLSKYLSFVICYIISSSSFQFNIQTIHSQEFPSISTSPLHPHFNQYEKEDIIYYRFRVWNE